MRSLSYVIALAFLLTGPSLACSTDHDMPGVGTFSYCGTAVVTPAPEMIAQLGHSTMVHWAIGR
jgi:hypothetical protein